MEDYKRCTNIELQLKLKNYENEYEAAKIKLKEIVGEMQSLDNKYNKVKEELANRNIIV